MDALAFHAQRSSAVERKSAQTAAITDLELQCRHPCWLELATGVDGPGNGCLRKFAECGGVERDRSRACAKRLSAAGRQRSRALQTATVSLGPKLANLDNATMNRGVERKRDRCLLDLAHDHALG